MLYRASFFFPNLGKSIKMAKSLKNEKISWGEKVPWSLYIQPETTQNEKSACHLSSFQDAFSFMGMSALLSQDLPRLLVNKTIGSYLSEIIMVNEKNSINILKKKT